MVGTGSRFLVDLYQRQVAERCTCRLWALRYGVGLSYADAGRSCLCSLGYSAQFEIRAFISMAILSPSRESAWASTLWNCAIDVGSAGGGGLLGLWAAGYGYSSAFWLMPLLAFGSFAILVRTGGGVSN